MMATSGAVDGKLELLDGPCEPLGTLQGTPKERPRTPEERPMTPKSTQ